MTDWRGRHVWCELMTTDPTSAAGFYGRVVGWTAKDSGLPGMNYTLFSAGERMVGGTMALPAEAIAMGARPTWLGYIAVEDVDAMVGRITAAGGHIYKPASDIPGIGRFAVIGDPQGASFIVFRPNSSGEGEPAPMGTLGHVDWNELHTSDLEGAFGFYSGLFGWTRDQAIEMGPMGVYQIFAVHGTPAGGMMQQDGPPHWLYYINVDAIDAAMSRVGSAGGKVVSGPQQVPGGSWIAQCVDPQGVMFAMVSQKR
jgi:predicted enzyme related to lactoylglutathione lyase